MNILVVDDDDFALHVAQETISRMGHGAVTAHDGREAIEVLRRGDVHLMITDWDMPGMNGIELCRAVRREDFSGYVYIIMLTGREGARQRLEGLYAGADDFLSKPLEPEELLVCLKTAERILSLETRDLALFAMAKLAESRDLETGAHVERVQSYARLLAQNLLPEIKIQYGVDEEYIRLLYQTTALHDLGKVGIPDAVLLKPGKLTREERVIMETHPLIGAHTLDAALQRFPSAMFLQLARNIAATHHEKFDGSGYPQGLVGQAIPLCGRIVALADVYDALTSRRVYKEAITHEQAKVKILEERGRHFDPSVVDAFLRAEPEIVAVGQRLRDRAPEPVNPAVFQPPSPPMAYGPHVCKILVIEDDPTLLAKLAELLAGTGEPVFAAKDGDEAMAALNAHHPRLVVADWVLQKGDGVEICRRIRATPGMATVHVIMLTVHSDKSRLLEAYKAGVDDFIAKPFDAEELLARVRAGLRAARLHDDLVRKAAGSRVTTAQLAVVNSNLERLSITDELTGLFNRRHAMTCLSEQWELAECHGSPLAVALVDIDHFKKINDTFGHDGGDAMLRQVAILLREQTRGSDTVCRMGGEEFLLILPSQTEQEAHLVAERLRLAVQQYPFAVNGAAVSMTISIGIAARAPGICQFTDLLKSADQAMYSAKRAGRNAIGLASERLQEQMTMNPLTKSPIDLSAVAQRCGGDPKFTAAVTDRFRTQAGPEVDRLSKALADGNADLVRRTAHNLKSMTAYMAADAASELAHQIESLGRANRLAEIAPILSHLRAEIERAVAWIAGNSKEDISRCA